MNNNEHTIHYTFGEDGYRTTNCPHCDFLLKVGSVSCHQCAYFVSHDYKRQIVTCKCPENHKLTDFEPKPVLINNKKTLTHQGSFFNKQKKIHYENRSHRR